jgi:hypothetical protein
MQETRDKVSRWKKERTKERDSNSRFLSVPCSQYKRERHEWMGITESWASTTTRSTGFIMISYKYPGGIFLVKKISQLKPIFLVIGDQEYQQIIGIVCSQ